MIDKKREAVIVATARTPIGKMRGALATVPAINLGAMVANELISRAGIDASEVEEVIFGNLFNYDWGNVSRVALLEAGFPVEIPAITLDRQCSSALNAIAYAGMYINTGNADIVMAGGIESYSQQTLMLKRPQQAYPQVVMPDWIKPSNEKVGNPSMIRTAENIAAKYSITREECDEFAYRSHKLAAEAWNRGAFKDQVFPVEIPQRKGDPFKFEVDECVRFDVSREALAKLRPVERGEGNVVTAGNASPQNDGATGTIVMSREMAERKGLIPLITIRAFNATGVDPHYMGMGPVPSIRKLLQKTGLSMDDIDLFEVNEAFAAQSLGVQKILKIPTEKLNVDGGAIAIGHPNGASGGILVARIIYSLIERNLKRGIVSFCCGGGQGFSVLLERD